MKKFSILFIAFLMLFSANVFAASYDLYVASVQVTDANKNNITGIVVAAGHTATGAISYDPESNVLTLNNATLNVIGHGIYGIRNEISNLRINLVGENTITAVDISSGSIWSNVNFKITGTGSLTINAYSEGIFFNGCNLTIENTTVTAIGGHYGIRGNSDSSVLTITNSTVIAYGTNTASIGNINSLILNGCFISQPAGAEFNASQKAVCLNGTKVKTEVVIEPIIYYNLWVAGVQVSNANKNNITGTGIIGSVNYNSETNTLTLDNAIIFTSAICIENSIANLRINLVGGNSLSSPIEDAMKLNASTKITGSGTLTAASPKAAIWHRVDTLTIENTDVTLNGENVGIGGGNKVVRINNSIVRATGTNDGSIQSVTNLALNGCAITQPAGAVFNAGQKAVCVNGEIVTTEIVIEPVTFYNLYVAGVRVNEANKDYITANVVAAGHSASGVITYDPASNTLTLEDANFSTSAIGIENSIANLTINLVGGNSLISPIEDAMKLNASTKITGSGTLTATSPKAAIWHRVDTLTIENTNVTLNAVNTGIGGSNKVVSINNSTVRATGANDGSISNISNLILNGCAITQPTGAIFDAGQKAVCVNGTKVKTEVIIAPFPTISVSDATACDSYTLPTSETSDIWVWTNENNVTVTDATESGVYTVLATSNLGATATASIYVTINQSVTNEITEVACASFEWNGTTYTNSGDYSGTFTAENGCDSVVTLHLTINQSVTNEITEVACGSFEWNGTTYTNSGDYSETFTTVNGCDSIVTLHLTINELPNVEIVQEGEILTASAGMETYAWNTNETSESITISATGNYSVTVTNAAGCENTADIEVTEIPTTGINEIAVSKIAVYPNPNNGEFTINLSGIDNAISYQVIDAKGAIVKEAKVNSNEEFVSIQAKAGNYTVKVITDSKVFVEQIIVQ